MPEAVASNSIPTSAGQKKTQRRAPEGVPVFISDKHFKNLPPFIQRDFDAAEEMLKAHGTMVAAIMETGDDLSFYANGIHLIYRLILLRMNEVIDHAGQQINAMHGSRFLKETTTDIELMERIGQIVADVYCDAGHDMDRTNIGNWPRDMLNIYASATSRYYRELVERAEGDNHLLTIGSLLPWLELKIRREIIGDETDAAENAGISLRDSIIADQVRQGVSPADLSQALGVRKAVIERTIGRLTAGNSEGVSDAARARIERAADEPAQAAY